MGNLRFSKSKPEVKKPFHPYLYPNYTLANKTQFKKEFTKALDHIEGVQIDEEEAVELVNLIKRYDMDKLPKSLEEIFEVVKEYYTSNDVISTKNAKLMASVYEALMKKIMQPKPLIEETLFFPSKEKERRLAEILSKAENTLEICIFEFTNDLLAESVSERHKAGVQVRIITDAIYPKFVECNIPTLTMKKTQLSVDSNKRFHMHNSYAIIDDFILINGSFNWTRLVNINRILKL